MPVDMALDSPDHHELPPRRLSALYQYHNAPEVAPAHGLEHDDGVYPSSDKYPVPREMAYDDSYYSSKDYGRGCRAPRIIFGMKVPTFLVVALVMILIIVGASVGGAVGGRSITGHASPDDTPLAKYNTALPPSCRSLISLSSSSSPTSSDASMPSASSSKTVSTPLPTLHPVSDCPSTNNTIYSSPYAQSSSQSVLVSAGLIFTKHCSVTDPLPQPGSQRIGEAFVASFSDCIDTCAGYNYWNDNRNCTVAVFAVDSGRPGNCWIGSTTNLSPRSSGQAQSTDVAFLNP